MRECPHFSRGAPVFGSSMAWSDLALDEGDVGRWRGAARGSPRASRTPLTSRAHDTGENVDSLEQLGRSHADAVGPRFLGSCPIGLSRSADEAERSGFAPVQRSRGWPGTTGSPAVFGSFASVRIPSSRSWIPSAGRLLLSGIQDLAQHAEEGIGRERLLQEMHPCVQDPMVADGVVGVA